MPVQKVKNYLNENKVNYTSIPHSLAYATREISHQCHISEKEMAKVVIVQAGSKLVMVIIPSSKLLDFKSLENTLHESDVSLATEKEFANAFPDCEVGAMPGFGNLYNMDVIVDQSVAKNKDIFFNGGTHTEIIKLSYQDFEKLVHPKVTSIVH